MTKQLMMYEKVVPLNSVAHKDLYVKTGQSYGYAKSLGSVPLLATEFSPAAMEYAIVFVTKDDQVMPIAITSVNNENNLYVSEEDTWKARYVPAFVRRYPFVFSTNDDESRLVLCIDESFAGLNRDGKGERLFDADGEQTQYLKGTLAFLENYQAHFKHTQLFCAKLAELDLLTNMTANINVPGVGQKALHGFQCVDRNKLKQLSAETLLELNQRDWLECVYLHLQSIQNFSASMERVVAHTDDNPPTESEPKVDTTTEE